MSKDQEFGEYLADAIVKRGYASPTDFARDANVSPSSVSRWLRNMERPSVRLIERIAPKLGLAPVTLTAMAYPDQMSRTKTVEARPEEIDPLADELGRMLSPRSQLTAAEREKLTLVVDAGMAPYRSAMKRRRRTDVA